MKRGRVGGVGRLCEGACRGLPVAGAQMGYGGTLAAGRILSPPPRPRCRFGVHWAGLYSPP